MVPLAAAVALALALGCSGFWLGARQTRGRSSRRQAAENLPFSIGQLSAVLEAAPLGLLLIDGQLTLHSLNSKAERLLNQAPGRFSRGQPLQTVIDSAIVDRALRSALSQQRPERVEWLEGEEPMEATLLPSREGWVAMWLNSRRSLESQLTQQGRWVSDVAHELKTPLTSLLLLGDSLAEQANVANAPRIERLQRELHRLQQLVGDLLELSRLENSLPGDDLQQELLDLGELVDEVWSMLRPLAEQRGVVLSFLDRPAALLWGDGSRLHRALLNLLDNAVRYSPDQAAVEVRIAATDQWLELEVRDHGSGFSEADLEHLFERFYRGDPSRVRSSRSGSGLGLAIVEQIALTHGGRVLASNHPGGGAVLELVLPKGA
ncbi:MULTISPECIES: cell wall metabolism sensor histidine kinase WalK [unclassified Synechococcus]|uniref:sensor histidine kinase n=1 Tax=unclassified Synechococcus TaxID=2626047 RepID=UPI0021A6A665|nr:MULTISPECIES: HAMP domain-containing sensor histidine kinase [unclassified Synechococcus]MCT0212832.1 HAMP domain-containing histidine kinase [Synechococcus sp. CS-1326]MCT0232876.1 HAMP domain-containing histidine kinase [Synechococcus sp. CS-1327]